MNKRMMIYEAGTRVPFIIKWPNQTPQVSDALVNQIDMLASLAKYTGQTIAANDSLDSQNQLNAWVGKDLKVELR